MLTLNVIIHCTALTVARDLFSLLCANACCYEEMVSCKPLVYNVISLTINLSRS